MKLVSTVTKKEIQMNSIVKNARGDNYEVLSIDEEITNRFPFGNIHCKNEFGTDVYVSPALLRAEIV